MFCNFILNNLQKFYKFAMDVWAGNHSKKPWPLPI